MLGDSHAPIWTHPYGLRWDRSGKTQHGLSVSHVIDPSKAFGPPKANIAASGSGQRPSKHYLNPFLVSLDISATELDERHEMTVGDFSEFSCAVELTPANERALERQDPPTSDLRAPVVRGMVFDSALYKDLTPQFYSNILIRTLTLGPQPMADSWVKYRFLIDTDMSTG